MEDPFEERSNNYRNDRDTETCVSTPLEDDAVDSSYATRRVSCAEEWLWILLIRSRIGMKLARKRYEMMAEK